MNYGLRKGVEMHILGLSRHALLSPIIIGPRMALVGLSVNHWALGGIFLNKDILGLAIHTYIQLNEY